jgi:hypothetical protein
MIFNLSVNVLGSQMLLSMSTAGTTGAWAGGSAAHDHVVLLLPIMLPTVASFLVDRCFELAHGDLCGHSFCQDHESSKNKMV